MFKVRALDRRAAFALDGLFRTAPTRLFPSSRPIHLGSTQRIQFLRRPQAITQHTRLLPRQPRWTKPRFSSSKQSPNPTPHLGSPEPQSLSQRLKKLSREYGWTALGVYLLLSALDFPFCFLAVRALGTERVGQWEHAIIQFFKRIIAVPFPGLFKDTGEGQGGIDDEVQAAVREGSGLEAAQLRSGSDATVWTQLALAYAVHKSLIFIRVPLTAAVLPKVVKTLRSWGYNIGKRTPKN